MSGAYPSTADDVAYYRPQEKKVQTSVYLSEEVHQSVLDLARLWSALDEAQLDPEEKKKAKKEWKPAEVMRRLIEAGVEGAWAEVGGRPENDEQWERLLARATKTVAKK